MASTNPTAPPVTVSCGLGRCRACKGQVVSLRYVGPCRCACHRPDPAGKAAA